MKKTIVLMTIVLAILAAPVFAEVGTSGSVEFDWAFGVDDNYTDDSDASAAITLDGTISDYTSISAEFSADSDDDASLSAMTLSQDVTGAMGVDGPVSFAYKLGYMDYSPVDYSKAADFNLGVIDATAGKKVGLDGNSGYVDYNAGTVVAGTDYYSASNMLGFKLMFGLADMVNVDVALYPTSVMAKEARGYYAAADSALEMGINAYGTFGIVDASVYFVSSVATPMLEDDGDDADADGTAIGFTASAAPVDGLSVGFGFEFIPAQDVVLDTAGTTFEYEYYSAEMAINAGYTMDALTASLGFSTGMSDDPAYDDVTFAEASKVLLGAKFAATEAVNLYVSFDTPLGVATGDLVDSMDYEVGADVTFDGVTYALGYTLDNDYAAYEAEFVDADSENAGNVYLKISASF